MKAFRTEYRFEDDNKYEEMGNCACNERVVTIYLNKIKTPAELFETIEHEYIHACLCGIDFFDEEEHKIIDTIMWMKL